MSTVTAKAAEKMAAKEVPIGRKFLMHGEVLTRVNFYSNTAVVAFFGFLGLSKEQIAKWHEEIWAIDKNNKLRIIHITNTVALLAEEKEEEAVTETTEEAWGKFFKQTPTNTLRGIVHTLANAK